VAKPQIDPMMAAHHPLRILLAEDNAVNQKLALRLLERMGYRADIAVNGLDALAAIDRTAYDVVLMDVQMPEMDGLEATRQLRRRWPDRPIRVVAMTANAMEGDREACLQAGMDDYLAKPIRPDELALALAAVPAARPEATPELEPASLAAPAPPPQRATSRAGIAINAAALDRLLETTGGDPAFLGELIDAYLADTPVQLAAMGVAAERGEIGELIRPAHSLKTNSANLGAETLSGMCRSLETDARLGTVGDAVGRVAAAEVEFEAVRTELLAFRSAQ
jgi:CheY-like chemotaxis protein/HPt (histidine-containing phosphotransfer) domain-containing protein